MRDPLGPGKLKITVLSANLTRNTDMFGKMDPYVLINHLATKFKTPVHRNGGKTPVWNTKTYFDI